jgi:hypothetical protein
LLARVPAAVVLVAVLAVLAVALPDRCAVNELGRLRAERTGDLGLGDVPRGSGQGARFAAACPGAPPAPPSSLPASVTILRAPYLQSVAATHAEVLWTSEGLADPAVQVRPSGPTSTSSSAPARVDSSARLPRGVQYSARLGPLTPGTTYCYEVRDGERVLAGPFGFATAPLPGDGRPIRLVALGDMGWRSGDQRAVLEQMGRVDFDLALLAGDIAYPEGTLEELERNFFAVYAPLMRSAPFFPATGNHDYLTRDADPFRQAFALPENGGPAGRERWYSFDWGDLHVVVLDSEKLIPAQMEWLEADLVAHASSPWIIALFHRAPYSSGERGPDMPTRDAFVPILTRHKVSLVITGHEHHYERSQPVSGITYLITGGGGRGTRHVRPGGEQSAFALQVAHFVYVVIDRDRMRVWAVDASGQTFDTAALARDRRQAG